MRFGFDFKRVPAHHVDCYLRRPAATAAAGTPPPPRELTLDAPRALLARAGCAPSPLDAPPNALRFVELRTSETCRFRLDPVAPTATVGNVTRTRVGSPEPGPRNRSRRRRGPVPIVRPDPAAGPSAGSHRSRLEPCRQTFGGSPVRIGRAAAMLRVMLPVAAPAAAGR